VDAVRRRTPWLLFASAALVYLADRLTKLWAARSLPGHPLDVISGVLTFRYTTNSGGAFGFGQSASWIFATVTIGVCGLIAATAFRQTRVVTALALGLVMGGALGNLTDRIVRGNGLWGGRVVDFIDLHVWPVFNVADASIVIGALILGLWSWRGTDGEATPEDAAG
jgi:signal peptidase II